MNWYASRCFKHLIIHNWWFYKDFLISFGFGFVDKRLNIEINLGFIGFDILF